MYVFGILCDVDQHSTRTPSTADRGAMPPAPQAGRGAKVGCVEVRVLASGTWDAPPSLLITCERADRFAYLVNAGEGLQRFCVEHKMRLVGMLQRVLFTRLTWNTVGGLPGLLLTMADGGQAGSVRLHGPQRLPQLVDSFRSFVVRHAMPHTVSETPAEWPDATVHTFDESGVEVTPILLHPKPAAAVDLAADSEPTAKRRRIDPPAETGSAAAGASDARAQAGQSPRAPLAEDAGMFGGSVAVDGEMAPGPAPSVGEAPALCWLLEMPAVPPKFNAPAAEALGVPSGELRSNLCRGLSVTLADGTIVEPSQVLSGGKRGELVLIVDCPSVAHVAALAAHPTLAPHLNRPPTDECADDAEAAAGTSAAEGPSSASPPPLYMVVHLTPVDVCASVEYAAWCGSVPTSTQHLFTQFTPQDQRFAFVASARLQTKLHGIHSSIFPKPCQVHRGKARPAR